MGTETKVYEFSFSVSNAISVDLEQKVDARAVGTGCLRMTHLCVMASLLDWFGVFFALSLTLNAVIKFAVGIQNSQVGRILGTRNQIFSLSAIFRRHSTVSPTNCSSYQNSAIWCGWHGLVGTHTGKREDR